MSESFWGTFVIGAGVLIIAVIFFMQQVTNTEEQNYTLIKETTQAAMNDALDYASYMADGTVRINREAFVENFIRRFSENASLSNSYVIEFYDINECPPKVSLKVKTKEGKYIGDQEIEFDITNKIDAIYETLDY